MHPPKIEPKSAKAHPRPSEQNFIKRLEELAFMSFQKNPIPTVLSRVRDDRFVQVNEQFEIVSGYSRDEVIGRTTRELGIWMDIAQLEELKKRIREEGSLHNVVCRFRSKSGNTIIGLLSAEPIDLDGELHSLLTVRDITQTTLAEETLRLSQRKLQSHLQQTMFGVIEWSMSGHVIEWNPAAEKIFGYTRDEALGRARSDLVPADILPDAREVWDKLSQQSGGGYASNDNVTKDGRKITCEWFNTPLLADDGSVTGMMSLVRDVTAQKQAEDALRISEERFSKAFHQSTMMNCIVDLEEMRYLEVNEAFEQLTGYGREELIGRTVDEVILWEDRELLPSAIDRLKAVGSFRGYEGSFRTRSGELRVARGSGHTITISGKVCLLASLEDITEQKRAETALAQSEARYRSLVQSQSDVIVRSDTAANLTFANDAYCAAFGLSREQILGHNLMAVVVPEDREIFMQALEKIKHPLPNRTDTLTRHLTPHGIRWFSWDNSAVLDDNGTVVELQSVGRDVTDYKVALMNLSESQEKFAKAFDATPSMEWILNLNNLTVVETNKAFELHTGFSREEVIGRNISEIGLWANADQFNEAIERVRTTGGYRNFERDFRTKSGELRTAVFSAEAVDIAGEHCIINLGEDITDQREAERARAEVAGRLITAQEEERHRIARELHDDIGQSLALLAIAINTAGKIAYATPAEQHACFSELWNKTEKILKSVSDLSHQLHSAMLQNLGLNPAVSSLCKEFEKQNSVKVDCSLTVCPGRIDPALELCFYRVLQESLSNIGRHSHAKNVKVHLATAADDLTLDIEDDGVGFNTNAKTQSQGLGLVSMRERLNLLGGLLSVWSEPGRGTRISARAPIKLRLN